MPFGETGGRFRPVFEVSPERFDELAAEAVRSIPPELAGHLENVAIFVQEESRHRNLFGLFEGVPLTRRSPLTYSGVMPDRITLYEKTICMHCDSEEEVRQQIRKTVVHEVAHHFGIGDARLRELGWA